jgi:pimeloyl-ACP methyl ester carboxylesterase
MAGLSDTRKSAISNGASPPTDSSSAASRDAPTRHWRDEIVVFSTKRGKTPAPICSPPGLVGACLAHSLGGSAAVVAAHNMPTVRAVVTIGAPFDVAHVLHQFAPDRGLDGIRCAIDRSSWETTAEYYSTLRISGGKTLIDPRCSCKEDRDQVSGLNSGMTL